MPRSYPDFHLKMKEFIPRENDVWVSSYPKAGTTWTQVSTYIYINLSIYICYANPTLFILLSLYVIEFSLAWNSHTWFHPTTLVISTFNSPKKIFKPISTKSSNFLKIIVEFVICFS